MPRSSRRAEAPVEYERAMLTVDSHPSVTRWAAGLAGCVLAASALTAALVHLSGADPLVATLAVTVAVLLAWVVLDHALTPLRAAQASAGETSADAVAPLQEFVDTQATWKAPGQESVDVAL
jgi:hypothetical protein